MVDMTYIKLTDINQPVILANYGKLRLKCLTFITQAVISSIFLISPVGEMMQFGLHIYSTGWLNPPILLGTYPLPKTLLTAAAAAAADDDDDDCC